MRVIGFLVSVLFLTFQAQSQTEALSPRTANYLMDIKLDPETKMLEGHTVLTWNNPSQDTIRELQFHLYYNAFKNTQTP